MKKRGERNNYFPWRRLIICAVGILILVATQRWSVLYLYTLPQYAVGVFGSITTATMYAITFIVAYFITGQVYFTNWTMSGASTIASEVKTYVESKKQVTKNEPKKPSDEDKDT